MAWKKTEELQEYGWIPKSDDAKELKDILREKPLLIEYPYLFKTITLAAMELGFNKVRDSLLNHPKCPKNYSDFARVAISNDDTSLLKTLVNNDFAISSKKHSSISIAIKAGSLNCVKLLLELGFKPNLENHEELVECLLHKNIDGKLNTEKRCEEEKCRIYKSPKLTPSRWKLKKLSIQRELPNPQYHKEALAQKNLEEEMGKTILGQYPYKMFMAIKSKQLCPIKKRIEWLKVTDPPSATSILFQKTSSITQMILKLEDLVKKTEKKILKLHCQKELGNIPSPEV